jgi:ribosomal protein S18 acetylase RimI-like enzyme
MENFKLVVKEPSDEELTYLENGIDNFNINLTGIPFGGKLAVLVYNEDEQLVGGANGFQWGDGFSVINLWLEKEWRGQDIGTQVLRTIEDQAAERGCTQVYLDTYSFQALGFYQKLGYEVVGTLENFPTPHTQYFLKKTLARS